MHESFRLRGERVLLRPTTETDRHALVAIREHPEVWRRWRGDDLDAEFTQDLIDGGCVQLTILTEHDDVVGLVQFSEETDPDHRHAGIDIYVAPEHHRRGYGSDALAALVDHLLDERGHHRITIDPAADNTAAIACYRSVGFRPVGVMRSYERRPDGTWSDGLLMDLLASDRPDRPPR